MVNIIKKYPINRQLETKQALTDYIGKVFESNSYGKFEVLGVYDRYKSSNNSKLRFVVRFLDTNFETVAFGNRIKSGGVRDYLKPTICGVGYLGNFSFEDEPSKHHLYKHWQGVIQRCYDINLKEFRDSGVVDIRWHSFENFVNDFDRNLILGSKEMKENPEEKWVIDKDMVEYKNQIYSISKCCFIPIRLNNFLHNNSKDRKYKYEGFWVEGKSFKSQVTNNKELFKSGSFDNPFEAINFFYDGKAELLNEIWKNDYPFLSKEIIVNMENIIKTKRKHSIKEVERAIEDGYFDDVFRSQKKNTNRDVNKNKPNIPSDKSKVTKNFSKEKEHIMNLFECYRFISETSDILREFEAIQFKLYQKQELLNTKYSQKISKIRDLLNSEDPDMLRAYDFIKNEKLDGVPYQDRFSSIFEDFKDPNDEIKL